jgi:hypothetical protein
MAFRTYAQAAVLREASPRDRGLSIEVDKAEDFHYDVDLLLCMNVSNRDDQPWMDISNWNTGCAGRDDIVWKFHIFLKMNLA